MNPWFDQDDLDELLAVTELEPEEGNTDPDDVPEAPEEPITKPGDLWILGNHRLLCGDSTNPQHVEKLMDGKKLTWSSLTRLTGCTTSQCKPRKAKASKEKLGC